MGTRVSIIVPTYNAGFSLDVLLVALLEQTVAPREILIVDSSSTDSTRAIAEQYGIRVMVIQKEEFDHGGTRTLAGQKANGDLIVYLTQDALPCDSGSVERLIRPLMNNRSVGAVFGRQVPAAHATPFATHLRLFNYTEASYIRTLTDKAQYGLKVAFCSNSFAAYRRSALEDVGWFRSNLIFGEDIEVCARMLMKGFSVAYAADAPIYHSHNYTAMQEFRRYFDHGVLHACERWLVDEFGSLEGEGLRYVRSEMDFLFTRGLYHLVPVSCIRSMLKLIGYKLGCHYRRLPVQLSRRLSMRGKDWKWSDTVEGPC